MGRLLTLARARAGASESHLGWADNPREAHLGVQYAFLDGTYVLNLLDTEPDPDGMSVAYAMLDGEYAENLVPSEPDPDGVDVTYALLEGLYQEE